MRSAARSLSQALTALTLVAVTLVAPARPAPEAGDVTIDVTAIAPAAVVDRGPTIETDPFEMLAVSAAGTGLEGHDVLQLRTRKGSGAWSAWRDLAFVADESSDGQTPQERGWAWSAPVWTGAGDRVQLRPGGHHEVRLDRVRLHTIEVPEGGPEEATSQAWAMTETPGIISRAQWGANESLRRGGPSYARNGVRMAFVHHTVHSNSYGADQADDVIRGIYAFHTQSRGWDDLGYNFIVDRFGRIYEGRAGGVEAAVIGAHAEGFNTVSTGVAVLGDFSTATPGPEITSALQRLLAWKLDVHHVDPSASVTVTSGGSPRFPAGSTVTLPAIAGHRDTGLTSCPGERLYAALPALRSAVAGTGLPKIYDANPVFTTTVHGRPVDLTARLSTTLAWKWVLTTPDGLPLATAGETGQAASLRWNATGLAGEYPGAGDYRWTLTAAGAPGTARPATGVIRISAPHPEGTTLRVPGSSTVWVIDGGRRRVVADGTAASTRHAPSDHATVSPSVLQTYPADGAGFREGSLLGTPDGRVWVVSGGVRRHIGSEAVFRGLGLDFAAVRRVSETVAATHPVGPTVSSASTPPPGLFVRSASGPTVYHLRDGRARPIPSPSILGSYRLGSSEIATISDAQLTAAGGTGAPLGFRDGTLVASDGRIWLISNGERRWIASLDVFNALGFDFADVVSAPRADVALHPQGAPVVERAHPDGSIVAGTAGDVWVVRQGRRVAVTSPQALASFALPSEVATPSAAVLDATAAGAGWRDGSLLGLPDGRVLIVTDGTSRHIASEAVFRGLGLDFADVRPVPASAGAHPQGPPVTSADALLDGMFVKVPGSAAVYLVDDGTARHVPSWPAFVSHRATAAEIANVTSSQLARLRTGAPVGFREGTLVGTPDGRVSVISDGQRRWIKYGEAFLAMGYDFAGVLRVSFDEVASHPVGPVI